jgi:hypothetical protein
MMGLRKVEQSLDALGGIQFQVPSGGHWDYRPGMNNNGAQEFTSVTKTRFDVHAWNQLAILADAAKGTARMAVSAVEALIQGRHSRQSWADRLADA